MCIVVTKVTAGHIQFVVIEICNLILLLNFSSLKFCVLLRLDVYV